MKAEIVQVHPLKLFSINDISELTNIPVSTLYAKIAADEFPEGQKIGKHRRWRFQDLAGWLDQQAA